jgi:hypothetical protein
MKLATASLSLSVGSSNSNRWKLGAIAPPMLQASLIVRSVPTMFEKDSTGRPITDFEVEEEEEEDGESTK